MSITRCLYSRTFPQRPTYGQKKVAVVERQPLWGGRGVTIIAQARMGSELIAHEPEGRMGY